MCWSSGPTGCSCATSSRCCPRWARPASSWSCWPTWCPTSTLGASETRAAARVKGDARMARVLAKAVRDRERPLREDLVVPFGVTTLRLTVARPGSHREGGPPAVPPPQRRPPLRRGRGVRGHGGDQPRSRRRRDDVRDRTRHLERGAGGAGADVAGAHAGRAAARPVRLPRPATPRRRPSGCPKRSGGALAPRPRTPPNGSGMRLVRRRRRPAGRGARAARPPRATAAPTAPTARSGPTATSWSTRCRT